MLKDTSIPLVESGLAGVVGIVYMRSGSWLSRCDSSGMEGKTHGGYGNCV